MLSNWWMAALMPFLISSRYPRIVNPSPLIFHCLLWYWLLLMASSTSIRFWCGWKSHDVSFHFSLLHPAWFCFEWVDYEVLLRPFRIHFLFVCIQLSVFALHSCADLLLWRTHPMNITREYDSQSSKCFIAGLLWGKKTLKKMICESIRLFLFLLCFVIMFPYHIPSSFPRCAICIIPASICSNIFCSPSFLKRYLSLTFNRLLSNFIYVNLNGELKKAFTEINFALTNEETSTFTSPAPPYVSSVFLCRTHWHSYFSTYFLDL